MFAREIATPTSDSASEPVTSVDDVRLFASMAYHVNLGQLWTVWPSVAKRDWVKLMANTSKGVSAFQPLGKGRLAVYPVLGYAVMRTPLLATCTDTGTSNTMWRKLFYSAFETCFGPSTKVLGPKHISNPDFVPF